MNIKRWQSALVLILPLGLMAPPAASAQSVADRTPNIQGTWTAQKGVVQFNFLHRFSMSDAPLRKITNTPTFLVGTGLTDRIMLGFTYGPNSVLVPAYPNEWEWFARASALQQKQGAPVDLTVHGAYNVASQSVDGELVVGRTVGRLRVLAVGRAFSDAYVDDEARFAVAGGAAVALTPSISVGGDWGTLIDRRDGERTVWSAGLQMGVPFTPHSFSIHASNVGTASLEGSSRGTRTRWGFEYTVPITVRRYTSGGAGDTESTGTTQDAGFAEAVATGDTVVVDVQNLQYATPEIEIAPGTTVVWVNRDPLAHTVTADDGAFDSGLMDPEASFALTFPDPGTFPYHCTPHPFMTGRVVVGSDMDPNELR